MTAIPEGFLSKVAGGLHHSTATNLAISAGDIIKPLSVETWGVPFSSNFGYNPNSGLFTLDSTKKYHIEADICTEAYQETYHAIHGFTDAGGTEITDSCRGRLFALRASDYYGWASGGLCCDETALAVIDGSVVSSFYWKVLDLSIKTLPGTIELDDALLTQSSTYQACRTRLIIREY